MSEKENNIKKAKNSSLIPDDYLHVHKSDLEKVLGKKQTIKQEKIQNLLNSALLERELLNSVSGINLS